MTGWWPQRGAESRALAALFAAWAEAPGGRLSHTREEHLIPLMVAAGASEDKGEHVYGERVWDVAISGFRFG
jgi:aromatic ring-opening dioxygenase catalytic subunit (LigB family)